MTTFTKNFERRFSQTSLGLLCGLLVLSFQNCSPEFEPLLLEKSEMALVTDTTPRLQSVTCASSAPATLSLSCLGTTPTEKANLKSYEPQYPLYSDGASKRRWIYIPEGEKIDTANPDEWIYPVGTILWKEFSVGGKKIETRQLRKMSPGFGRASWEATVYLWRSSQEDADLVMNDVNALPPEEFAKFAASEVSATYGLASQNSCFQCHGGTKDVGLGFNYLQLSSSQLPLSIDKVSSLSWLTVPPLMPDEIPGSSTAKEAIGYIQTNCASCHNPRGLASGSGNFLHRSNTLYLAEENLLLTANARPGLIVNGDPTASRLLSRIEGSTMPPRYVVPARTNDDAGIAKIRAWIQSL